MTKQALSKIFTAAWTLARQTRDKFETLRAAFAAALRQTYASLKVVFVAPEIASEIRGGKYGAGAWIARLTGLDAKFGFAREFVQKSGSKSRSGRSGSYSWTLPQPGIYELRGLQYGAGRATIGQLDSGFVHVAADGTMTRIAKDAVLAAF